MAKLKPEPSLAERIEAITAECNALIDRQAEENKKAYPDIPIGCLRQTIMRGSSNPWQVALRLLKEKS
jgi:hypothetical protein